MLPTHLEFEECSDQETRLGEGPLWDSERQVLWFVDILAPAVLCWEPKTATLVRHEMPDLVTSVSLAANRRLVVSLRKALYHFAPSSGELEHFVTLEDEGSPNRLNDGKVGPDGALWIGSMHATRPAKPTAALFRVTADGKFDVVLQGLHVSNGLAWSPDGRTMYHADTRAPCIRAWDFDPQSGRMDNVRILARPTLEEGLPDGAAVDANGNYWCAGVTAGCLHVFSPTGRLLRRFKVPMQAPTMPCFGGEDGRTLFLTGLTREGSEGISLGKLMACRTTLRGTPAAVFGASPTHGR